MLPNTCLFLCKIFAPLQIDGVSVGDLSEKQISALIRGKRVIVTVRRMHIMGDTGKG